MKYWLSAAIAACLVLAPIAGQAATTKKHHRTHMHRSMRAPGTPGMFDPSGGNAAAGGNNANSMSGPNSAPENAEGRTSGGGGSGMGK
jgi:hypothetical protein